MLHLSLKTNVSGKQENKETGMGRKITKITATQPTPHYHMVINGNFRKINADLVQFNN